MTSNVHGGRPLGPCAGLFRLTIVGALLALALTACSRGAARTAGRGGAARRELNVVMITIDTLRADHVSCYGRSPVSTPHMDALAARGVRFARAFAQVPLTTPSHASILTGTYPPVHGIRDNGGFVLGAHVPTLAGLVRDAGYQTAAFVAAAVLDRIFGLDRGFDLYADQRDRGGDAPASGRAAELRGEVITDRVLEWVGAGLKRGVGKPGGPRVLVWAHYFDPHAPYDPPSPYREQAPGSGYAGEVAYVDRQVGRLLEKLDAWGLRDETLVVLLSDHGESLGEHGEFTHGVFLYDSTTHIPLIMAGPGIRGGRVVSELVRSIDVMPTIVAMLGLSVGDMVQGVSLEPALRGERVRRDFSYAETLYPRTNLGWADLRAVRTDEFKLIVAPQPELYSLADDPGETRNVIDRHPAEAERLDRLAANVAASGPATTEPQAVDPATRSKLQALGYVGASGRAATGARGADPKERVHVLAALERAEQAILRRDYRKATLALEAALSRDPTNPAIYEHLSHCYERRNLFREAIRTQQRAIASGAAIDQAYARLGRYHIRLGQLAPAAVALAKATELEPGNLAALSDLATVYMELGRSAEAERTAIAILTRNDRHAGACNVLGIIEARSGRMASARTWFEKALRFDPALSDPHLNLAILAEEVGKTYEAAAYYRAFLERAGAQHPNFERAKTALARLKGRS